MAGLVVVAFRAAAPQAGFVALVLGSDGQEAPVRIAEVNHDGLVVFGAHFPDRIETRVVGLDVTAVAILDRKPQFLGDLQSLGAVAKTAIQLRRGLFRPARLVDPLPVHPGELDDAILESIADLDVLVERRAESAVHIGDHGDAGLIHEGDHLPVVGGGLEGRTVEVEVDHRKFRPGDFGSGKFHQGLRHRRHFRRRLEFGTIRLPPKCQHAGCGHCQSR